MDFKREFIREFNKMARSISAWQAWSDLIVAMACSLANALDHREPAFSKREQEYKECIKRLGGVDTPAKCFAYMTQALEANPEQDFLGELFMQLELGNHWKGQFFTPYSVCKCMAGVTYKDELSEQIKQRGYITVADQACGAGATLIAMANLLKEKGINYQRNVLFAAQDLDRTAALMCFIQLTMLGCPAVIVVADSLSNPMAGDPLFPKEQPGQEFWYTPFYNFPEWKLRRISKKVLQLSKAPAPSHKLGFIFFYNPTRSQEERKMLKKMNYTSAKEKLTDEKMNCIKTIAPSYRELLEHQYNIIFDKLIDEAEKNMKFAEKVLDPDKTWDGCLNYMISEARKLSAPTQEQIDKARKGEVPIAVPVTEELVVGWAKEFYDLDHVEAIKPVKAPDHEKSVDSNKKQKKEANNATPKSKAATKQKAAPKKESEEIGGQMSIFDLI